MSRASVARRSSHIIKYRYGRNTNYNNVGWHTSSEMGGDGLVGTIQKLYQSRKQLYPGERHMPLVLPDGSMEFGNYIGPGTQTIKRLEKGDEGKTPTDMVAKMHDIQYTMAQASSNKKEQLQKIRDADKRMVKNLKEIQKGKHGGDNRLNIQAGMRIIQSKMALENRGMMNKSKYAGNLENIPAEDMVLMDNERKKLEQKGYGLPASKLKKQLLRKQKQSKLSKKYNGSGFNPTQFITSSILPIIIDKLKIDKKNVNIKKIQDLIKKLKVSKIDDIVKIVLPHLFHGKMKTSGMAGGTAGLKSGYKVLPDFVAKNLGKLFMYLVKRKVKKGSSGSGLIQDLFTGKKAQKFWKGFKKGFVQGFTGTAKIAEPLLNAASIAIPALTPVAMGVSTFNSLT